MHNVWLIASREYRERIRTKGFLIMTILIPLLLGGIGYAVTLMGGHSRGTHLAIVSPGAAGAQFGADLKEEIERNNKGFVTEVMPEANAGTRATLDARLKDRSLDGYLWVTPAAVAGTRPSFEWVPKAKADVITQSTLSSAIRGTLTREGLLKSGMTGNDVDALLKPVDLDSAEAGKPSGLASLASVYAIFFIMYFTIVQYGMNVSRSIIEEKNSRIFEVLLATIKPGEMMAGKVLGVGAVGLTQIGLWIGAALIYFKVALAASGMQFPLSGVQMVSFLVFFLLGYTLYSSVAAALGAMTGSEQELQQLNMILMLPLILCSVFIFRIITDSDGILAKAFSFFPFTTPLIMYVRISVHQPPAWQIALSVFDLVLMILITLWIASRIYRVGILMYGKKPNLPEILRWLKYS